MNRGAFLALSVVACGFGVMALTATGSAADFGLGMNFVLAALLAVLTAQDLRHRGWRWQAVAVGISYLLAPLVGLVLYALASGRGTSAAGVRTA